jgi:hypothetical protein
VAPELVSSLHAACRESGFEQLCQLGTFLRCSAAGP